MWPLLQDGRVVTIYPCRGRDVRPGDVVLVDRGDRLVLHRALRTSRRRVLVKGDACIDVDGWVPHARLIGRLRETRWDKAAARISPRVSWPLFVASALVRRTRWVAAKF